MTLPNPPTSSNGSKLFAVTYDNAGTNTAAVVRALKQGVLNSENVAHMAVATHVDSATYSSGDPVVLLAGINGTDILPVATNGSGHIGIQDGGNSITVDGTVAVSGTVTVGTHAVTQSGGWNVGISAGTSNIGDVDVASIAAGTTTIGGILDTGWDNAAKAPLQGIVNDVSATSAQSLQSTDASNLYNIYTVFWSYYSGSTAPAAFRTIKFRYASGGTTFHTVYIPPTANLTDYGSTTFRIPVRTSTNNDVDVILSGALGTGGVYSAGITCHKSTS